MIGHKLNFANADDWSCDEAAIQLDWIYAKVTILIRYRARGRYFGTVACNPLWPIARDGGRPTIVKLSILLSGIVELSTEKD